MWRTLFNITLTLTLTTGLGLELTTGLGLEFKIYRSIFLQCLFGYLRILPILIFFLVVLLWKKVTINKRVGTRILYIYIFTRANRNV